MAASQTVQKCSMGLGGNAPFIVFDDADLDLAAEGIIAEKFRNHRLDPVDPRRRTCLVTSSSNVLNCR